MGSAFLVVLPAIFLAVSSAIFEVLMKITYTS